MAANQPVAVTAALPYANGDLHIGHAISTYIPADIYARFLRLKGVDVVFVCGSDDHGTPIEIAALKSGTTPLQHVDYYRSRHIEDFKALGISFDNYYRTHSEENRELTDYFLLKAYENGYIYEKEVEHFYCENDRKFLPDRFVKGTCPYCGAADQYSDVCERCGRVIEASKILSPTCAICGSTPRLRRSVHFFLKLSAFRETLYKWLSQSPEDDFPKEVVNYVLNWIKAGLEDWDITREDYWGFKLPFKSAKENQYAYVWVDAPIGYIASTVNYGKRVGVNWEKYWKDPNAKIVHFIGKDIVYHHFIFWPALLLAAGFPLPKKYVVNGYVTFEGEKLSKSRGWLIPLRYMAQKYPADYLRFYAALKSSNTIRDTDFSFKEFQERVNSDLADNVGNFAHRVLLFAYRFFNGAVPDPKGLDEEDLRFKGFMERLPSEIERTYELAAFSKALEKILAAFAEANRYLNLKEPWRRVKESVEEAKTTIYLALNLLRDGMVYLYPVTPSISTSILSYLYEDVEKQLTWSSTGRMALKPGQPIKKPVPVVRKITDSEIEEDLEALKSGRFATPV